MAAYCQSVKSLEAYFTKASREKEYLEEKIRKAVDLQKELSELESVQDFMTQNDFDKLRRETMAKEQNIFQTSALHQQKIKAKEKIASIKNSGDYLDRGHELKIQTGIQFKKSLIEKAVDLQSKITQIEKNPEFLTETSLESMKKNLELLNNVLRKIQTQDQNTEEAKRELLCVSCSRFPEIGTPIFSCLEHHLLCWDCVQKNFPYCLTCNQFFGVIPPIKNNLAERMIRTFKCLNQAN